MTFLSNTWGMKPILLGLCIHFALWCGFSVWLWRYWLFANGVGGSFWSTLGQIVAAPTYLGIFCLYPHFSLFWEWGVAGIVVSIALLTLIFFSLSNRYVWVVVLTHFVVALYWLVGLVLLAAGE